MAPPESPDNAEVFNLERCLVLMETTFSEACQFLELADIEPSSSVPVGKSVLLFDPARNFVFSGAVIMDDSFGFFGVVVGSQWLTAAEHLESQGFAQADAAERFTKSGPEFGTSIYLYPDDYNRMSSSKVQHYSINVRHGRSV